MQDSNALVALERQLQPLAPRFAQVLPKHITPDRLIRTVMISVERLPRLLECTRQSIFNAAMSAACLGLEVDGVTGQAYLIPFNGQAQLVIGYKGYVTMAARSGITITGAVVRDGDEFDYQLGTGAFVRHKPAPNRTGRIIAAWACAQSMDRPAIPCVMSIDELLAVKAKSPGAKRSDSPWNEPTIGFPAMCEKTAKRRLSRSLPLNVMQLATRIDEAVDEQGINAWLSPDKGVVIDGDVIPHHDTRTPTTAELIGQSLPAGPQANPAASSPSPSLSQDEAAGPLSDPIDEGYMLLMYDKALAEAAEKGVEALKEEWAKVPASAQKTLKAALDRRHKPTATAADARREAKMQT